MVYCISDIHGEYDRYKDMLTLVQFSDNDTLYVVLGDVIDRGPDGVDALHDIMHRPNVHMMLGNHEAMFLATLGPHNEVGARELWEQNGGDCTRADLLYCRRPETREAIINYLMCLPDYLNIEVNGKPYHLVHGYPAFDHFNRLWSRPNRDFQSPMPGTTVIVGHTPTPFLTEDYDNPCAIWYGNGIIDIDCGCGHNRLDNRRLACLRLDDMTEFYI